jgi:hypothetical protein
VESHQSRYSKGADFDELWQNVLRAPENPEAHKRFISFAVLSRQHLLAAERYGELPDPALAERYRKSLAMQVAAAHLVATPSPRRNMKRARMGWLLIGTGIGFCLAFLMTKSLIGLVGPVAILVGALEVKQSRE